MVRWFIFFTISWLLVASDLLAQKVVLEGRCRDRHTHEQIQFVNIISQKSGTGTTTDINGRFVLELDADTSSLIVFSHIAYEKRTISVGYLKRHPVIDLQSRMIPLEEMAVYGERTSGISSRDLPATMSVLPVRQFENKGFIDTGDILQADHSIQTNEAVSGKKTVTLRGGNADDVYVIHNGVRLNNNLNNEADVSNLDLSDIESIEIIKGTLTSLYGPDAVSGVINLVPKKDRDYSVKFRQLLGPYRNGEWNLQLHRHEPTWYASAGINQNAYQRLYQSDDPDNSGLRNRNKVVSGTAGYRNSRALISEATAYGMLSSQDYENRKNQETIITDLAVANLSTSFGDGFLQGISIQSGYRKQSESQDLSYLGIKTERQLDDESLQTTLASEIDLKTIGFKFVGQYEYGKLTADDFINSPSEMNDFHQTTLLTRDAFGTAALIRVPFLEGLDWLQSAEISAAIRYDQVNDNIRPNNTADASDILNVNRVNTWEATVFKLSGGFQGIKNGYYLKGYLNFGNTVKFPRLIYQVSKPVEKPGSNATLKPDPEKIQAIDAGLLVTRDFADNTRYSGWQFQFSFFRNLYENKIRNLAEPQSPVIYFDVVGLADISGADLSGKFFFFERRLSFESGASLYNIPEKAAFPFKSDRKLTVTTEFASDGYQIMFRWFTENEQIGWVRTSFSTFEELKLPSYSNMDVHLSKQWILGEFKSSVGLSGRNLLKSKQVFEAQVLRDQRIYLIFSIQY